MNISVNESALRGKNVIATKNYLAGELVLEEKPIMVVPKEYLQPCKDEEDYQQSLSCYRWFKRETSVQEQAKVLSLFGAMAGSDADRWFSQRNRSYPVPPEEVDAFVKLTCVMSLNKFDMNGNQILYSEMPKFAHSCDANCQFTIEPLKNSVQCRANRPISAGEEMTVSYSVELDQQPKHIRRQKYLEERGFTCHCPRCDAPGDDTRQFKCSEPHCRGVMMLCAPSNEPHREHSAPHLLPCTECHAHPPAAYESMVLDREKLLPIQITNMTHLTDALFSTLDTEVQKWKAVGHKSHSNAVVRFDFDGSNPHQLPAYHAQTVPIRGALVKASVFEFMQFVVRFHRSPGLEEFRQRVHDAVAAYISVQERVTRGAHVSTLQVLLNVCRVCIFALQGFGVPEPVYRPYDAKVLLQKTLRMLLVLHGREEGHQRADCAELCTHLLRAWEEEFVTMEVLCMEVCAFCEECPETVHMKRSRCGACRKVMYCSAGCQKTHWKLHKKTCF